MTNPSTYSRRAFLEVCTGAAGVQIEQEGWRVTIITEPVDGTDLRGQAFVTLRPIGVFIRDPKWEGILGASLRMQGGVELDIDDVALEEILNEQTGQEISLSQTVPVVPRDLYLPAAPLWVRLYDLVNACERCNPGEGHRATGERVECEHHRTQFTCPNCFYVWWRARARIIGIDEVLIEERESKTKE